MVRARRAVFNTLRKKPENGAAKPVTVIGRITLWVVTLLLGWLALKARPMGQGHPARSGYRDNSGDAGKSDRGRTADGPAEIPPLGWKDILVRTYRSLSEDRVTALAAAVTYYILLALFPGLTALVSIYGLVADPADIGELLSAMSGAFPREAIDIVNGQLHQLTLAKQQALGLAFLVGLLGSVWSANAAMKALFDALNVVYGEMERRNFFRLNALSLCFTVGMILFLVLAMITIVVIPAILDFLYLGAASEAILRLSRWPAMLAVVIAALAVVYRYGPCRADARWRWVSWGSIAAATLWLLVSMLFSWYASNFGNYNKTYGSLGAVIAFMVWTWLSATIVLMGGELNAEIEHQTARDSTAGPSKPMGTRGAKMADTLGAAQE